MASTNTHKGTDRISQGVEIAINGPEGRKGKANRAMDSAHKLVINIERRKTRMKRECGEEDEEAVIATQKKKTKNRNQDRPVWVCRVLP